MSSQKISQKRLVSTKDVERQNLKESSISFQGNAYISQSIALSLLYELFLPKVVQAARLNKIVKQNLGKISAISANTVVSQLGSQLFTQPLNVSQQNLKNDSDSQAKNIPIDNMMVLSVQATANQRLLPFQKQQSDIIVSTFRKQKSVKRQQSISSVQLQLSPKQKINERTKKSPKKQHFDSIEPLHKKQSEVPIVLPLYDTNQAEIDLIRMKMEELRKQKQEERLKKLRKTLKGRDQKISYDYQGNQIKVQQKKKDNLIKKILRGSANMQVQRKQSEKIIKIGIGNSQQMKNGLIATKLEVHPVSQQKQPKRPKVKSLHQKKREKQQQQQRNVEVIFSDVNNLLDKARFDQNQSIGKCRLIHERRTVESKRQKILSVQELKKQMVTRKVNKDEYLKIKQFVNSNIGKQKSTAKFDSQQKRRYTEGSQQSSIVERQDNGNQNLQKRERSLKLRVRTEASNHYQKKGIIITHNDSLKNTLIENNNLEFTLGQQLQLQLSTAKKQQQLGEIDQYNLLYVKNNGSVPKTYKKYSQQKDSSAKSIFPNLVTPNKNSIHIMPRNHRLKESGAMVRQLRKNFQEKLRK